MTSSSITSGKLATLQELNPSSPYLKQGASFRVTGKLQDYNLERAVAVIVDGDASLKVDTQHLKLNLRKGSLYQFIGELHIEHNNEVQKNEKATWPKGYSLFAVAVIDYDNGDNDVCEPVVFYYSVFIHCTRFEFQAILKARVGRNVDGLDLNLYHQSLQLLKDFQAKQINNPTA